MAAFRLFRPWTWRLWHWLLLLVAIVAAISAWWAVDFRVMMPRDVQHRLFGKQIVGPLALTGSEYGCCAMDGSGLFHWHYRIPPEQAKAYAARCVLPGGGLRKLTDATAPYYDELGHSCVFARGEDKEHATSFSAETDGQTLTISLFYEDV